MRLHNNVKFEEIDPTDMKKMVPMSKIENKKETTLF